MGNLKSREWEIWVTSPSCLFWLLTKVIKNSLYLLNCRRSIVKAYKNRTASFYHVFWNISFLLPGRDVSTIFIKPSQPSWLLSVLSPGQHGLVGFFSVNVDYTKSLLQDASLFHWYQMLLLEANVLLLHAASFTSGVAYLCRVQISH